MSDNFYANFVPSGDDEEERKLRAWQALAGDQAPHRTMANQVQLPEMDVSTPNIASGRGSDFGAMVPGNIDLSQRPHVRNADGSTSTVYSMGANIDDKEMLLPGVNDLGYVMTPDQAIEEYRRTGKNLGQYASPAASDAAGEAIHQQQMRQPPEDTLRGRGGPGYDMTPPEPDAGEDPRSADGQMIPGHRYWNRSLGGYATLYDPKSDLQSGTDAQKSPELPPDAPPSATARLGSMLSGRDQAPAPPESLPRDEPRSSGNDASPWAVLADVLLNKGRGVGGILAQGAAGKSDMRRAELDLKRAQAEHLRDPRYGNRGASPEALALRARALDLQESGQKAAEERARLRAQGNDPDGKKAAGLLGFYGAHGVDTGGMEGLDYTTLIKVRPDVSKLFTNALAPATNQVAADRATGVKRAEGEVRDERAQNEADNAALKAGAEARARTPSNIELKQTPGAAPEVNPLQQQREDRAAADQYNKETGYARGSAQQLMRVQSIVDKYKDGDIPGVGMGASMVPDALYGMAAGSDMASPEQKARAADALELSNAKKTLAEMSQRKESGAAGPEAERFRYLARVGASPGASTQEFKTGIEAANKLMQMELRSYSTGKEKMARESLRNAGLEEYTFGKPQPQAAAAPAVGRPDFNHDGNAPPDGLQVVPGKPAKFNPYEDEELKRLGLQ